GNRCGPSARIFRDDSRWRGGGGCGFVLVRLVSRLELHVGEERRLIEQRTLETPPQRIAKVVSSCTCRKYVRRHARITPCDHISCRVTAGAAVGRLTTSDDRSHRTPATDCADVPKTEG